MTNYIGWGFILLAVFVLLVVALMTGASSMRAREELRNERDQRFLSCVLTREDIKNCRVV